MCRLGTIKTWILLICLAFPVITETKQKKANDAGDEESCMMPVTDLEATFSQDDLRAPPLLSTLVSNVNECTSQCCQTDRCNVALHMGGDIDKNHPGDATTNCVMYACHPTVTCSFQQEDGVHVFMNKRDYIDADDVDDNDNDDVDSDDDDDDMEDDDLDLTTASADVVTPSGVTSTSENPAEDQVQQNNGNDTNITTSTLTPATLPPPPLTTEIQTTTPIPSSETAAPAQSIDATTPSESTATSQNEIDNGSSELISTVNPNNATTPSNEGPNGTTISQSNSTTPVSQIEPPMSPISTTTLGMELDTNTTDHVSQTTDHVVTPEANSSQTTNQASPASTEEVPSPSDDENAQTSSSTTAAAPPTQSTNVSTTNTTTTENAQAPNTASTTQATTSNPNMTQPLPSIPPSSNGTINEENSNTTLNNTSVFSTIATVFSNSSSLSSNVTERTPVSEDMADTINILLICAVAFGCVFLLATVGVLGKRIYEGYRKRHYSRLDYLINGMYN